MSHNLGGVNISADPGLGQGRGGAWDHRKCGTSPSSLSTVKPILQPSSHINSFCRLPALKPSKLHLAGVSKFAVCQPLQTLTWHASSCSQQPPRATHQQAPQGHTSMASYGHPSLPFARPKTLQTLQTLKTLQALQTLSHAAPHINGFLWPLLQPTGTPGPHINAFLWAPKSAVCPP